MWVCGVCTYAGNSGAACDICRQPRQKSAGEVSKGAGRGGGEDSKWSCPQCTLMNSDTVQECSLCGYRNSSTEASAFTLEKLSATCYKIVEADRHGQFPFVYVILGKARCAVVDTGCDTQDIAEFIDKHINRRHLPIIVINTHVHFDHISGNHQFQRRGAIILMGGANRKFSKNVDLTSLCMAHGCRVKPFKVNQWLHDGDCIDLDGDDLFLSHESGGSGKGGAGGAAERNWPMITREEKGRNVLHVIFTPGHSLDSISLFSPSLSRIFVGDLLYPYTAVPLSSIGASLEQFIASVERLKRLNLLLLEREEDVHGKVGGGQGVGLMTSDIVMIEDGKGKEEDVKMPPGASLASPIVIEGEEEEEEEDMMDGDVATSAPIDLSSILSTTSASFSSSSSSSSLSSSSSSMSSISHSHLKLSCGHVEANLIAETAIHDVLALSTGVLRGTISPSRMEEDGVAEFTLTRFSLLIPLDELKKAQTRFRLSDSHSGDEGLKKME